MTERQSLRGQPGGLQAGADRLVPAMIDPPSPVIRRAGVVGHTQSLDDDGLTGWTAADRPIMPAPNGHCAS